MICGATQDLGNYLATEDAMDRREEMATAILHEWHDNESYVREVAEEHGYSVEEFMQALRDGEQYYMFLFDGFWLDQALEEADERGAALDYKINDDYSHDDRDWN